MVIGIIGLIPLLLVLPIFYRALALLVRNKLRAELTALDDLPLLARPRDSGHRIPGTAVICGGSIAGLFAARVCSDHFEKVVIVDPEEWIATEEGLHDRHREASSQKRSRVPQYTSLHGYQPFSTMALRNLFPNLDREVLQEGARFLATDPTAYVSGVPFLAPHHQYPNGTLPDTMFLTRPGYETVLRRLVSKTCSNVTFMAASVNALLPESSAMQLITAVRVRSRAGDETEIPASLVVDCTGLTHGGMRWLENLDGTKAEKATPRFRDLKTTYDHKMAYTTVEFDVPEALVSRLDTIIPFDFETAGNLYTHIADPQKDTRALAIARREKNYLQMACGGWDFRSRVNDTSDIKSFVSQIVADVPLPKWIPELLTLLEEENVPATYVYARIPPSAYIQYHCANKLPPNFVALGDSVLLLNPVKGQGCTKACVDAVTLNAMLTRLAPGTQIPNYFSRRFFATLAKRTGYLWEALKADDYAWKTSIPAPGDDIASSGAWRRAYGSQVLGLALKDREVAGVFWHVANWLAPPTDLFSPEILLKLAWVRVRSLVSL